MTCLPSSGQFSYDFPNYFVSFFWSFFSPTSDHIRMLQVFATANPSGSSYISVTELSHLLTAVTGKSFNIVKCRKIMSDIDTDGDGSLSILDVLSIFYLTELYLKALSGKACGLTFSACRYMRDVMCGEI